MLAKQDETSAKAERVSAQVKQLTVTFTLVATTHSDNIQFLLQKVQSLEEGQQSLRRDTLQGFEQVNARFEQIDNRFEQIDNRFDELATLIKSAINKP